MLCIINNDQLRLQKTKIIELYWNEIVFAKKIEYKEERYTSLYGEYAKNKNYLNLEKNTNESILNLLEIETSMKNIFLIENEDCLNIYNTIINNRKMNNFFQYDFYKSIVNNGWGQYITPFKQILEQIGEEYSFIIKDFLLDKQIFELLYLGTLLWNKNKLEDTDAYEVDLLQKEYEKEGININTESKRLFTLVIEADLKEIIENCYYYFNIKNINCIEEIWHKLIFIDLFTNAQCFQEFSFNIDLFNKEMVTKKLFDEMILKFNKDLKVFIQKGYSALFERDKKRVCLSVFFKRVIQEHILQCQHNHIVPFNKKEYDQKYVSTYVVYQNNKINQFMGNIINK